MAVVGRIARRPGNFHLGRRSRLGSLLDTNYPRWTAYSSELLRQTNELIQRVVDCAADLWLLLACPYTLCTDTNTENIHVQGVRVTSAVFGVKMHNIIRHIHVQGIKVRVTSVVFGVKTHILRRYSHTKAV